MDKLYQLKENLERELETWAEHPREKYDMNSLQAMKATASALDHLCNVMKSKEEEGGESYGRYLNDYGRRARDSRGRFMEGGNGYSRAYHDGYGHDQSQEVAELKRRLSEMEQNMRR